MSNEITLAVMIDALRYDYVDEENSSFIHELMNEEDNESFVLRETFGFQTRPAYFAGLYPSRSDISNLYVYEPDKTPYKFLRTIPRPIRRQMSNRFFEGIFRKYTDKLARFIEKERGYTFSAHVTNSLQIPLEFLDRFAVSEKYEIHEKNALGDYKTIFDIFREKDFEWLWLGYPGNDLETESVEEAFLEQIQPSHDFAHLHYSELDSVGHTEGPSSKEREDVLKEIDESVRKIVEHSKSVFDEVNLVVFGDHGMVPVSGTINIERIIEDIECRPGKDFMYFLGSTQARFWFRNEDTRKKIESQLRKEENGQVMTEEKLKEINADVSSRYGDLIFLSNPGKVVFPNFFSRDSAPKGMHGYHPETEENHTRVIFSSSKGKIRSETESVGDLVDIFPTLLELMELDVPKSNQGQRLAKIE